MFPSKGLKMEGYVVFGVDPLGISSGNWLRTD